jgi:hypothetical protein
MDRHRHTEIDRHIGRTLKMRMLLLGVTPRQLAPALRMSICDLHRALAGRDRLSAGQIYDASVYLVIPVASFFTLPT